MKIKIPLILITISICFTSYIAFGQVSINEIDSNSKNKDIYSFNYDYNNNLSLIEPINPVSLNETISALDIFYKISSDKKIIANKNEFDLVPKINLVNDNLMVSKSWDSFLQIIKKNPEQNDNGNDTNIDYDNTDEPDSFVKPKEFGGNIIFLVIDSVSPDENPEGYAIIYSDKKRMGHTSKALLSEYKFRKMVLDNGKHLIQVEKFKWDNKKKDWQRYANFEQPKPFQITIKTLDKVIVIEMIYNSENKSYHTRSFYLKNKHLDKFKLINEK